MIRITNCIFSMMNIMLMMFGIATISSSLYLRQHSGSDCQKVLQNPLMIIGVFILVMALIGLMGSFWNVTIFLWMYSFVSFVMVIGLAAYLALTFVVTNEGAGKALSGLGFKEYRLGDYSNWLRNHFEQGKNWDEIRSCLVDAQVCRSLGLDVYQEASDFYKQQFSPVQSGCCKPPRYCGFEFKNATFWIMPKSGPSVEDSDCTTWSNTQDKLCYDCKSCKRGVLDNIKNEWRSLAVMNFCLLAFVVLVYSTSCCTRRNLSQSKYYKDYYP
ncbi:hypothetical protein P3X46_002800 [Hevea brasiliensis]|uniref:Uncharacterized protein n=1 Tax=Hevea brasiliensis TaxID=3981 RepID=A0ABQ9N545_HEVBR|nr:tetraspanin-8-like [Hevea brasiliensis]KAJ9187334.1 hypothetical protein P3X46_002800 [Hevea brasiliensis]